MIVSYHKYLGFTAMLAFGFAGGAVAQCTSCPAEYSQAERESIQAQANEAAFREGANEAGAKAGELQGQADVAAQRVSDHERAQDPDMRPELEAIRGSAASAAVDSSGTPDTVIGAIGTVDATRETLSDIGSNMDSLGDKRAAQFQAVDREVSNAASADRKAAAEAQRDADDYRTVQAHLNSAADGQRAAALAAAQRAAAAAENQAPAKVEPAKPARTSQGSERPDIGTRGGEMIRFDRIDADGKPDLQGIDRTG